MTYLINPIWFYLIGLLSNIKAICDIVFIILFSLFGLVVFFIALELTCGNLNKDEIIEKKKLVKKIAIPLLISILVLCVIPSEETCYKMIVSSVVTSENIDKVESTIKDSVDYIFEKMDNK